MPTSPDASKFYPGLDGTRERTLDYIAGSPTSRDAIPFPRTRGNGLY